MIDFPDRLEGIHYPYPQLLRQRRKHHCLGKRVL
jgi:hypothetical protein